MWRLSKLVSHCVCLTDWMNGWLSLRLLRHAMFCMNSGGSTEHYRNHREWRVQSERERKRCWLIDFTGGWPMNLSKIELFMEGFWLILLYDYKLQITFFSWSDAELCLGQSREGRECVSMGVVASVTESEGWSLDSCLQSCRRNFNYQFQ